MAWTDELEQRLRDLSEPRELTAEQIGKELGKSKNAITGKLHRMGLSDRLPGYRDPAAPSGARVPTQQAEKKSRPDKPPAGDVIPLPTAHPFDVARKTLAELDPRDCRWPVGDPGQPGFGFCALEAVDGGSYCQAHADRAYRPLSSVWERPGANDRRQITPGRAA